jgi:hypothetical protein
MATIKSRPIVSSAIGQVSYESLGVSYREWYDLTPEARNELVDDYQANRTALLNKYNAIAGVYQTADSILTGASVDVRIADFTEFQGGEQTHAMTHNDGQTIYINEKYLSKLSDEMLLSLNGMNYHEVAHLLFTPRMGSEFLKTIVAENLLPAFNILEDNRVDTFLSARFPSVRASLIGSTLSALATGNPEGAFLLTRGRRFLPIDLRQISANAFINAYGATLTKQVADIIDEYRFLALPNGSDSKRGIELVREFAKLLDLYGQGNSSNSNQSESGESGESGESSESGGCKFDSDSISDKSCSERLPMKSGRNESGKKQSQISERAKASDGNAEDIDGNGESDGNESDTQSKGNTEQESGESGNPNASYKTDGTINESPASINEQLANTVERAIKDVLNSSQAKQELKQVRNAIREIDTVHNGLGNARSIDATIDPEYRIIARAFADELTQLQIDSDPAWQRHTPTGKLNVQRTMNMDINDINILFDRWSEGNEAFDIEAVILVDTSGSMGSQINEASKAVWTIKRSLESIDANVTAYTFDDESQVLYKADESAKATEYRSAFAGGSTDPSQALLEAERIFQTTRKKTKLLFIVSDGEWFNETRCNDTIQRINAIEGASTSAVFITSEWQLKLATERGTDFSEDIERWKHKCNSITLVTKPRDIIKVARDVAWSLFN